MYKHYPFQLKKEVISLRKSGMTYSEINTVLNVKLPKSTLSNWCRNVELPQNYKEKITALNFNNLNKGRKIAVKVNRLKKDRLLREIDNINFPISQKILDSHCAKIALAMLCLGEASKYHAKTHSFYLGNSNPKIIVLFLELMKRCFDFKQEKIRCTLQCRADQNTCQLQEYWQGVTKLPKYLFYKPRIDPRTKGKPTKKFEYKGVLRIDYLDKKVQLDLESLSDLIYNTLNNRARSLTG